MKQSNRIPNGLTLEEGLSAELIIQKLENAGIEVDIDWDNQSWKTDSYFRASTIAIDVSKNQDARTKVIRAIGQPEKTNRENNFYYGKYRIKQDFDWSSLTGRFYFDKGLLVESVRIWYV